MSDLTIARCPICGNEADTPKPIAKLFDVRCKTLFCLAAPARRTKAEAIAVWNEIAAAFSQRQLFYNELYDFYMSESAWEHNDRLRAEYPELDKVRSPEGIFDTVVLPQKENPPGA